MSYNIQTSKEFETSVKKLFKRYRSLPRDLEVLRDSLLENPFQGTELCPNIRKVRMGITSKGRGKSGGARVITATAIVAENEGRIALLTIYDKSDASNINMAVIKHIARNLGFEVDNG